MWEDAKNRSQSSIEDSRVRTRKLREVMDTASAGIAAMKAQKSHSIFTQIQTQFKALVNAISTARWVVSWVHTTASFTIRWAWTTARSAPAFAIPVIATYFITSTNAARNARVPMTFVWIVMLAVELGIGHYADRLEEPYRQYVDQFVKSPVHAHWRPICYMVGGAILAYCWGGYEDPDDFETFARHVEQKLDAMEENVGEMRRRLGITRNRILQLQDVNDDLEKYCSIVQHPAMARILQQHEHIGPLLLRGRRGDG
eukprot:GHVU01100766.1.p1 GENE.GHVU01100766.1~~GHVU01100766.1.p1  ORF type:complete len:257 (+),score=39.03 GHVU01100766.1:1-771(+)